MSAVLFLQTKPNIQYISNTKHQLSADNVKNIFGHKWITHTMYLKKKFCPSQLLTLSWIGFFDHFVTSCITQT